MSEPSCTHTMSNIKYNLFTTWFKPGLKKSKIKATTFFRFKSVCLYNSISYARVQHEATVLATQERDGAIAQQATLTWGFLNFMQIPNNDVKWKSKRFAQIIRRIWSDACSNSWLTNLSKMFDMQKYISGHLIVYDVSLLWKITCLWWVYIASTVSLLC